MQWKDIKTRNWSFEFYYTEKKIGSKIQKDWKNVQCPQVLFLFLFPVSVFLIILTKRRQSQRQVGKKTHFILFFTKQFSTTSVNEPMALWRNGSSETGSDRINFFFCWNGKIFNLGNKMSGGGAGGGGGLDWIVKILSYFTWRLKHDKGKVHWMIKARKRPLDCTNNGSASCSAPRASWHVTAFIRT